MTQRILIVDDEARIREVVEYALVKEGYSVVLAKDGREALSLLEAPERPVDLVVLDVMLPGVDGLEVCRRLRKHSRTPILFLSARGEEIDRVVGLELGGDDYLAKPFSPRELVARVRAILRRVEEPAPAPLVAAAAVPAAAPPRAGVLRHGRLELDAERHEARHAGALVPLTATEFGLLSALLERPGVVLSRGQLMQRAYRYDNLVTERTIDTHVRRVRAKFRAVGGDPIATVHGVGYKVTDLPDETEASAARR